MHDSETAARYSKPQSAKIDSIGARLLEGSHFIDLRKFKILRKKGNFEVKKSAKNVQ